MGKTGEKQWVCDKWSYSAARQWAKEFREKMRTTMVVDGYVDVDTESWCILSDAVSAAKVDPASPPETT